MGNSKPPDSDRLARYRAKRSPERTTEPYGSGDHARPRLYCIQKHAATRLHYDLRLEWAGTLLSWAVPRGPSPNPEIKRLAVHVEDHPVDYADFEGIIPPGNYGAGTVIVWDKGIWIPNEHPDEAMEKGVMHFEIHGYKVRGKWILIRTKGGGENEWLLVKKADEWSGEEEFPYAPESVLSGLTIEALRDGSNRAAETRAALAKAKAPKKRVNEKSVKLMLASRVEKPFDSPDWFFELKYDGYRIIASRDGDISTLRSRNGHDLTDTFPEVALALRRLPYERFVLDGELVVLDETGRPSFQRLQNRAKLNRKVDIEYASVNTPTVLFVFDLLGFEEFDLRPLPLATRKQLLEPLVPKTGPLRYADHVAETGVAMYAHVGRLGVEGILAKDGRAPYRGGRSKKWLKIVVDHTDDFVVVGFTEPKGGRTGFGALHLGIYEDGRLVYAGRVGTGFTDEQLERMRSELEGLKVEAPLFEGSVPTTDRHVWIRPEFVAEVTYKEVTNDAMLRAPVFVRLRDDKRPEECVRERGDDVVPDMTAPPAVARKPVAKTVHVTNLDKVFWPEEKLTKGDLIEYYRAVSPWLLPYLQDRPMVLTRYPDGIEGKSFYQKNVPDFLPRWVRTESIWSEHKGRYIKYVVCDDVETLLYIANSASIPLHIWSSRAQTIQQPDWCILDLDPKEAPFENVVTLAKAIKRVCDDIELPAFVKTSGSSGLHVLLPLDGRCTYEQSRQLGQLISRIIEAENADIATTTRVISERQGKVYLDFLQNRHGQLLVTPYSVRPLPGAPVSAPLGWKEVNAKLSPRQFTMTNLLKRLSRLKSDPMRPLLSTKPNLVAVLERLAARIR